MVHWDSLTKLDLDNNPWTCECENQWILEELMPIYVKINEAHAKKLTCGAPIEMEGKFLYDLMQVKSDMRCLDYYGNRPERDGTVLIIILAGECIQIIIGKFTDEIDFSSSAGYRFTHNSLFDVRISEELVWFLRQLSSFIFPKIL